MYDHKVPAVSPEDAAVVFKLKVSIPLSAVNMGHGEVHYIAQYYFEIFDNRSI